MSIEKPGTAAIDEPFPSKDSDHTLTHAGYRIITRKLPILKAAPIELWTQRLGIAPPEMIFGDNLVRIEHIPTGWYIEFNAYDALDRVDKKGDSMLAVSYSQEWQKSRENKYAGQDIKGVVKPFDWSYSTDYAGTVSPLASHAESTSEQQTRAAEATNTNNVEPSDAIDTSIAAQNANTRSRAFQRTTNQIPLELLARRDPILFFDETILYESELDDNGIALLSIKIRVMPQRLLLLQRFFMRLDDVVFRIRDIRVYVEFATGEVMREYVAREEPYESVRNRFAGRKDSATTLRDPAVLAEGMPVVDKWVEKLLLK